MQFLGQHFLNNKKVIQKILTAIDIQPDELIVEIGPGHGELTESLITTANEKRARIIAVEKDKTLAENLQKKFANEIASGILTVVAEDAREFLKGGQVPFTQAPATYKLVGNLPYYLTGHLLRLAGELTTQPTRCVFMIQKEVADRIIAEPPKMNRLAASIQFWAEPKIITLVPKTDFSPPPKVESAVIQLDLRKNISATAIGKPETYYAAVHAIFAQPRKTLLNNLATLNDIGKEKAEKIIKSLDIDLKARPQNLSITQIEAIAVSVA
jgi:16S rRNA (adenine1518-N6/adenine1519-N6)-dimethyltransferase